MSEETKKIELTEQELDQVAGGFRSGIGGPGNVKAGQIRLPVKGASPMPPIPGKASKEQQD